MKLHVCAAFMALFMLTPSACMGTIPPIRNSRIAQDRKSVLARMALSSVRIEVEDGAGSGTVISSDENGSTILTCAHVIVNNQLIPYAEINVILSKYPSHAILLKYDNDADLALLHIEERLPALKMADKEPELFDTVYLLGIPIGMVNTASEAIITNLSPPGVRAYAITGGFVLFGLSGGTACNVYGELIGVPQMVRNYNGQILPQIGFAIRLPEIRSFLRGIIISA